MDSSLRIVAPCPGPGPCISWTAPASSTARSTRSAASPRARGCRRTRPTASPRCCASCSRTRSPSTWRSSSTRPGRTFRHDDVRGVQGQPPADGRGPRGAAARTSAACARRCGMPVIEVPGFEADDVIATLSRQAVAAGLEVVVVSADKDLLQLVADHVRVLNPGREGSGSTLLRPPRRRGEVGRAARAGRGRAGARRRRGGQRAGRGGHRRQGRARPGARVRLARGACSTTPTR